MLDEATREEPAQHALDDRTERAVRLGEALLRLVCRYRPGSGLILALNEERDTPGSRWTLSQRHLALKLNYLARF